MPFSIARSLAAAAALACAPVALGQNTTSNKPPAKAPAKPSKEHAPKPAADEPKKDAAPPAPGTGFPAPVKKNLYADNDVRGKAAPKLEVEKWLTSEPERKGKVVLIDFWATWCPPCRALIPELNELQKTFKDDLVVIGISDEKPETVKGFMDKQTIGYSMAIDTKARTKGKVGVKGIPHVLVIGSDGVVRWQGFPQSGEEKLTEETVRQIIAADKAARHKADAPAKPAPSAPEKKPAGGGPK